MQAERPTIMSTSFPSFMSVYGSEESSLYRTSAVALDEPELPVKRDDNVFPLLSTQSTVPQPPQRHQRPHAHRGSINSLFSESTESSPTTSNSTFDSPIVSDNSTTSSPESATSMIPATSFRMQPQPMILPNEAGHQTVHGLQTPSLQDEAGKNVKKLTLDMNMPTLRRPATASGALDASSAPISPLKEPMRSARKKPTNLTIRTPGYNQLTFPRAGNVPPTPSQRPGLHHMQSSPALASLASPKGPPAGGMFLPLPSLNTQNHGGNSSNRNSFMASSMPDLREENENLIPKSQETPERGYTEGPVCIYDCGVYLYLEPTPAEASEFDLVINVAKEIKNPFRIQGAEEGTVMSVWRNEKSPMSEPQTALSEFSFKSAWEYPSQLEPCTIPSATTPTQSSFIKKAKQPEYVHVKWDHNSEILEDLFPLCQIIDQRIADGKKVLIHCQLGVSRSASLIIAYGLYKNYQPDFHSMYTAVKSRSRWVGPNMSLIYQLTDFKNKLNRGTVCGKAANPDWFAPSPDGLSTPVAATSNGNVEQPSPNTSTHASNTLSSSDSSSLQLNKALPPVPLFSDPPSAVSSFTQPPQPKYAIPEPTMPAPPPPPAKANAPVKRAASKPLPFRERFAHMEIPAHKPRRICNTSVARPPSAIMDLAMNDVPSTPSIFSPRATEFTTTPFNIRGAGDLSTASNRQSKEIPTNFSWLPLRKDGHQRTASKDPRSPHQHSESTEMYRNIDRYL